MISKHTIKAVRIYKNYLEDNQYRLKLADGGTGRHKRAIKRHQKQIDALKKDLETIGEGSKFLFSVSVKCRSKV